MTMRLLVRDRSTRLLLGGVVALSALVLLAFAVPPARAFSPIGELDCNGFSTIQQPLRPTMNCTDIRGAQTVNANVDNGRFSDNGHYIGHDEPDMTFNSSAHGSGNDVSFQETLGADPVAAVTDKTPGSDVSHWFELSPAPWWSMDLCDPNSYPQANCTPESDANAAAPCTISANPCPGGFQGGGSAFMEYQLYPPGFSPFVDSISCDNTHWCSALTIDSLECTFGFVTCNSACEEPINFAFIQRNGVPAGPPSPQKANLATQTQNGETLLMNPGDTIRVHMFDAPVPGQPGVKAFKIVVDDLTTHQSGFMQASAANGFMSSSIKDCSGTPINFQPAYDTAGPNNISPWTADRTDVSTQFETGHFEPCRSLAKPGTLQITSTISDSFFARCHGPYERTAPGGDTKKSPESTDAPCYFTGDTHGALNSAPDTATGCTVNVAGGDLDFDGSPYWTEWPTGAAPTALYPSSFVEALPQSQGQPYPKYQLQTDLALSESTCQGNSVAPGGTLAGCAVPAPNSPGGFYPFWSRVGTSGACVLEFGNVATGAGVDNLGKDSQYGTNQEAVLGYPQFLGPVKNNTVCH